MAEKLMILVLTGLDEVDFLQVVWQRMIVVTTVVATTVVAMIVVVATTVVLTIAESSAAAATDRVAVMVQAATELVAVLECTVLLGPVSGLVLGVVLDLEVHTVALEVEADTDQQVVTWIETDLVDSQVMAPDITPNQRSSLTSAKLFGVLMILCKLCQGKSTRFCKRCRVQIQRLLLLPPYLFKRVTAQVTVQATRLL